MLDVDGRTNGRIESFCAGRGSGLLTRLTQDYQQDLQLAFKMFDVDGDGYVCAEDLKHIMKSLGNDLSGAEVTYQRRRGTIRCGRDLSRAEGAIR